MDTAESTAVKSSDVAIAVDHGIEAESVERDVIFGMDCESVNVEFPFIEAGSSFRPSFVFLAMAIMVPTSTLIHSLAFPEICVDLMGEFRGP